jgi:DNA polymerase III sliding clamp (beta) subunit (PCNA family)
MNNVVDRLEAIEHPFIIRHLNTEKICYNRNNNNDKATFNLSKKFFLEVFKVIKTASTDSGSRPKMQKVYFNCKNNLLEIVACDGKVLAKLDKTFQFNVKDFNFLITCSDIYDVLSITEYRNENGHPNCDKVIINEFVKNMTGGGF